MLGTEVGKAIPQPVFGGREAARLEWTTEGPTRTVEGPTREDGCRLQALHGAAPGAREIEMKAASEHSVFLAAHDSHVGTLSDLDGKFFREGAADITFRMETEKRTNFLSMVWSLMVEQT